MRAVRTLPVLLALNLNLAPTNGISAHVELDKVAHFPAHLEHVDGSPRQTPQVTPTNSAQKNEAVVERNRRSSAGDLLALLPKAGGAKGVLGKNNDKKRGIRLPPTAFLGKAVAVNAVSWAAVVGGTMLWSRTMTGPEEGLACGRSSLLYIKFRSPPVVSGRRYENISTTIYKYSPAFCCCCLHPCTPRTMRRLGCDRIGGHAVGIIRAVGIIPCER